MWPLQLTYSPQLLAKYIQSQNINPTNKCFPIVGRINTITIYIYIYSTSTYSPNVYICIEYILATIIWQGSRMRLGVTAKVRRIWKWSNGVKISEMGIFWCISITNNVNSCKKFNEKAQMANFSVLAKGRRPRQELFAKKYGIFDPQFVFYCN